MNDLEVTQTQKYAAKLESKDFDLHMTPHDSQAVYLKKREEAGTSDKQLGKLELTGGADQATTATVIEGQETSAKQHQKSFTTDGQVSKKSAAKSEDAPWYERQWQPQYHLPALELILHNEMKRVFGNAQSHNQLLPRLDFLPSKAFEKNQ
jgi:hypothetical protein